MFLMLLVLIDQNCVEFREVDCCGKNLGFVLIEFEEGCFSLLILFHLSKKHVLVTCSKNLLNITAKITLGCKT